MAIAEKEVKLLWGRAAGYCSNPECRIRLAHIENEAEPFLLGEMAHIVARNVGGPRSNGRVGPDIYENLILLCPTCHTKIDKAPDRFSLDILKNWKTQHEQWVENALEGSNFINHHELYKGILNLLGENRYFFEKYGPKSRAADDNPGAPEFTLWLERRLDTIIPNNKRIISLISLNERLLDRHFLSTALAFKDHALAYEKHIFDRLEIYPLFPVEFSELVDRLAHER